MNAVFSRGDLFRDYLIDAVLSWRAPIQRYRARHVPTGAMVLLCLRASHVTRETAHAAAEEALFGAAVRELRALSVEHLPPILDGGFSGGLLWVAMEHVHGFSLRDAMVSQAARSEQAALSLALAVARALKAAHEAGKHHFRLTPGRIFITEDFELRALADFGLYELFGRLPVCPSEAAYCPPEQLDDADIDERADIYALGMILYAALSRDEPYANALGKRPDDIARLARLEHPTPLVEICQPPFPPFLDDIVRSLSAKDPTQRPATWDAAIALLEQAGGRVCAFHGALNALADLGDEVAEISRKLSEQPGTESDTGFRLRPEIQAALLGHASPENDVGGPLGSPARADGPVDPPPPPPPSPPPPPPLPPPSPPRSPELAPGLMPHPGREARLERHTLLPFGALGRQLVVLTASLGLLACVAVTLGAHLWSDLRLSALLPNELTSERPPLLLPTVPCAPFVPPPALCPPGPVAQNKEEKKEQSAPSSPQSAARPPPKAPRPRPAVPAVPVLESDGSIPADPEERLDRVWGSTPTSETH